MKIYTILLLALVGSAAAAPRALSAFNAVKKMDASSSGAVCPPPGYDSVKDFDLERYISAPWYTQKQVVVPFQPKDTFYCVRAEYVPINSSNLLEGVDVKNYANRGAVNGPATGTSGSGGIGSFPGRFIATVPNSNDTSKLSVGFAAPGTTMQIFGAPYWVVGIAPDYSWAIITGGPPESPGANGGCTTAGPMGDSGFWLFARKPVDPVAVAAMETEAKKLGLDTSVLLPVAQEGCKYESA